jgi:hypothetical protein
MTIPLVSDNALNSLVNTIESGLNPQIENYAFDTAQKGILSMEIFLSLDVPNSVRDTALWHYSQNELNNKTGNKADKLRKLHSGLNVTGGLLLASVIIMYGVAMILSISYRDNPEVYGFLSTYFPIIWAALPILGIVLLIGNAIAKKITSSRGKRALSETRALMVGTNPWALLNYTANFRSNLRYDLDIICGKLNLNPIEMRTELGKANGGGSTWIGFGGLGALGVGIGLSAISQASAKTRNNYVNAKIALLEDLFYYNNVAYYFNSIYANA